CGLWLNLPQNATTACIQAIVARIAPHIGPTVPVHLELANELFTFPTVSASYNGVGALINGLPAGTAVMGGTREMVGGGGLRAFNLATGYLQDAFVAAW